MALDTEVGEALKVLQNTVQIMQNQRDQDMLRVVKIEDLFAEHIKVCSSQSATLEKVEELMGNIEASYKVSNMLRKVALWLLPLGAGAIAFWRAWRGLP